MNTEHEWERLYRTAVLETDWSKMDEPFSHCRELKQTGFIVEALKRC